ncbi:hypothetical protein S40288_10334 [Stachybotrys chartarum IBT 40288]|nr:hypothetical protein S40288_10334 [Stachybotrys chartarum IBT 40288]
MYLFKYLFKGPDRAHFRFQAGSDTDTTDEYKDYVSGRYLSSSEAAYRILSFNITSKEPAVRSLSVHLENEQLPQFSQSAAQHSFKTDLLWYFQRPKREPFLGLTYPEFYARYYYDTWLIDRPLGPNQWLVSYTHCNDGPRQRVLIQRRLGKVITRLRTVAPRSGELFYFRVLLQHRPASGFADLRLVDGVQYRTYQEAATVLGLFQNVTEARYALEEAAASYCRPAQLRFLFACLLLDFPSPALALWEQFRAAMSADFVLHCPNTEAAASSALRSISRTLRDHGATLEQFGLSGSSMVDRELSLELAAFADRRPELLSSSLRSYGQLNDEQRYVFDAIYSAVSRGRCFFVDGKAGRGKTFLMNALCNRVRGEGSVVCITGSTALSVIFYERGRTAHSMFGIPVRQGASDFASSVFPTSPRAELLRQAALVLWEEFPMANKAAVECADELLRRIMNNDCPFGDKTFVAIGDFRQVAPVTAATTAPAAVFDSSVRSSWLWPHFEILRLTIPIRTGDDPLYSEWLDRVGDGVPPYDRIVPLIHLDHVGSLEAAADFLFPPATLMNPTKSALRSFLSPFNLQVDEFNQMMLSHLPGREGLT